MTPSNQQQVIEQAKFTYSPLGKALEKQIKTIEDQGQRQIKTIQNQGEIKAIKKYSFDNENTPLISEQKELFNELVNKRFKEIANLDKKFNSDDLIYRYKSITADVKFDEFNNAFSISDETRDGKRSLAEAKNGQAEFKSNLNEIKKGNKKDRSKEQKNVLHNIDMLYKARNSVIEFFDDYSSMISEAKLKASKASKSVHI